MSEELHCHFPNLEEDTELLWFYAVFVSTISYKTQFDWREQKTRYS